MMPDIGKIIRQRLEEEGRSQAWLARQINSDQSNLCKMLKKSSMDSNMLLRISLVLHFNFFVYFSNYYIENQQNYTSNDKIR